MMFGSLLRPTMVDPERALRGRAGCTYPIPATHTVLGTPLQGPWPAGTAQIYLATGCFWGAERAMWRLPGVVTAAVGYQGGAATPRSPPTRSGGLRHDARAGGGGRGDP